MGVDGSQDEDGSRIGARTQEFRYAKNVTTA